MSTEEIFAKIYRKKAWQSGDLDIPLSGEGSIQAYCEPYTTLVFDIVAEYKCQSILDCGHGDWSMWPRDSFSSQDYLGVDVVSNLSQTVQNKLGNSKRNFIAGDIVNMELPQADILITKDVLQHLSNEGVVKFLNKLQNFPLIIICNDYFIKISPMKSIRIVVQFRTRLRQLKSGKNPFYKVTTKNNSNIVDGNYRGIDLELEPFESALRSFEIIKIIDFDAPRRKYISKRIYVLKRNIESDS